MSTSIHPVIFEGSQGPNGEEFEPRIVARYGNFRVVEEFDYEDGGSTRALERVSTDRMGNTSWRPVLCDHDSMYPLLEALRALCRHGVIEEALAKKGLALR